jgi:hypothetical protein
MSHIQYTAYAIRSQLEQTFVSAIDPDVLPELLLVAEEFILYRGEKIDKVKNGAWEVFTYQASWFRELFSDLIDDKDTLYAVTRMISPYVDGRKLILPPPDHAIAKTATEEFGISL